MSPYQEIAIIFIVLGAMFFAGTWFFAWCFKRDMEWLAKNPEMDSSEVQAEIAAKHCEKVLRKRYLTVVESEGGYRD